MMKRTASKAMPIDMNAVTLGGLSGRYRFFDSIE